MNTRIKTLVCLLEEPSAEQMFKAILPKILSEEVCVRYLVFEGKQDLEKQIEKRIKFWQAPDSFFLVMRDQDSGDCVVIKQNLLDKISIAGKLENSIVRIACHELESFYLGDLQAVEDGLQINGLARLQKNKKYRNPDRLANASEELNKLTKSSKSSRITP